MIGYRRWQTSLAIELLQGRGLSEGEAKQHISVVSQKRKVPIFASATVIAGLDSSQRVATKQQQEEELAQAEYQSIYGGQPVQQTGSAFAPPANTYAPSNFVVRQPQFSAGTQEAAADAMAMFVEEENQEIIDTNTIDVAPNKIPQVVSGGVQLPSQVKSKLSKASLDQLEVLPEKPTTSSLKSIICPHCNAEFKIAIPDAEQAIVECPSCSKDFKLRFE